jgi:hypothetical protein
MRSRWRFLDTEGLLYKDGAEDVVLEEGQTLVKSWTKSNRSDDLNNGARVQERRGQGHKNNEVKQESLWRLRGSGEPDWSMLIG